MRDVTHILSKVSCFLLKSFQFRRLQERQVFFPYKSLHLECYATMPMLADAHIQSLGYLCGNPLFHRDLPSYLYKDLERLQKRAMKIIYPELSYATALELSCLLTLYHRREAIAVKLFDEICANQSHRLHKLLPSNSSWELDKILSLFLYRNLTHAFKFVIL